MICEELDRPRPGEEKEKLEDAKEKADEKDAIEKRKSRGAGGKKNAKIYLKLLPKNTPGQHIKLKSSGL